MLLAINKIMLEQVSRKITKSYTIYCEIQREVKIFKNLFYRNTPKYSDGKNYFFFVSES